MLTVPAEDEKPEFAVHWTEQLGCKATSLTRLNGGNNNRVFRCGNSGEKQWVIKAYRPIEPHKHDTMMAEIQFLGYGAIAAKSLVPELQAVDMMRRCVVMEYIEGDLYVSKARIPSHQHLHECASFIARLNQRLDIARTMVNLDAAEGYTSLEKHLSSIRKRFLSMGTEQIPKTLKTRAVEILGILERRIDEVHEKYASQVRMGEIEDCIRPCDRWVSPSDFGFHNAVLTPNRIRFIDFEFAGWDDPVKTLLDFWMQPRITVPQAWIDQVAILLDQQKRGHLTKRLAIASDIFELKWAVIILSVLNPERMARLMVASSVCDTTRVIESRLNGSINYLGMHFSSRLKSHLGVII